MRRIAPLFLCLLLVYAAFCPAFCLASMARETGPHSCCNHKQKQAQTSVVPMSVTAPVAVVVPPRAAAAPFTRPHAPRLIDPPLPGQLAILRI